MTVILLVCDAINGVLIKRNRAIYGMRELILMANQFHFISLLLNDLLIIETVTG